VITSPEKKGHLLLSASGDIYTYGDVELAEVADYSFDSEGSGW